MRDTYAVISQSSSASPSPVGPRYKARCSMSRGKDFKELRVIPSFAMSSVLSCLTLPTRELHARA